MTAKTDTKPRKPLVVAVLSTGIRVSSAELRGVESAAALAGWTLETVDPAQTGPDLTPFAPLFARADGVIVRDAPHLESLAPLLPDETPVVQLDAFHPRADARVKSDVSAETDLAVRELLSFHRRSYAFVPVVRRRKRTESGAFPSANYAHCPRGHFWRRDLQNHSVAARLPGHGDGREVAGDDLSHDIPVSANGEARMKMESRKASARTLRRRAPRTVRLGMIGLGPRGESLAAALNGLDGVEVCAICDVRRERVEKMLGIFRRNGKPTPKAYSDAAGLIADTGVEGVLIPTSWNSHLALAAEAMSAGKYAAIEVGGASSIEELWRLVHAAEKTGVSCMMLENCCYGRDELMVMNMVRQGLFGETVYAEGGYQHCLSEMGHGVEEGNERAVHNFFRNADLYPTHQLGPIAKTFDINRGNRFLSLTSTASCALGFAADAVARYGHDGKWGDARFVMGDVVTTVIKCARGQLISLTHCVSLPRPYSRHAVIQGTRGCWDADAGGIYVEGVSRVTHPLDAAGNPYEEHHWDPVEKFRRNYEHPIWRDYLRRGVVGGHGGMDGLVLAAFADAIREGRPTPIDVYDVAAWMATTALSEQSIALGSAPVCFPDFTNGRWMTRGRDTASGKYAL